MKRSKRVRNFIIIMLASIAAASSPLPVPADCGTESGLNTRLADLTLKKISHLPDRDVPVSGALFLITARTSKELLSREADGILVEKELDRLALRVRELADLKDPAGTVFALNRVIFDEEGFVYEPTTENPDNYLLDRVLARRRGNCLGLTSVYLSLAERLDIPLGGVYVPSHCFVRYAGNGASINIETAEEGGNLPDDWYMKKYRLKRGSPYLRTLGRKELIGVYLNSVGASYSRKGKEAEALRIYAEAGRFFPQLPDIHFNAGVSCQKIGKTEEAVARYTDALALDPDMVRARGNLAAALCSCGRVDEGIREFRKALDIDPRNVTARSGLARAYFARGDFLAALEHCDRAQELGCSFDPAMLEILARYRAPGSTAPER